MKDSRFYPQVELLLRVLPVVAREQCFALKGGTAINLFHRDMPRLSVDIDLIYLPLEKRESALQGISDALGNVGRTVKRLFPGLSIRKHSSKGNPFITRLLIGSGSAQIKIDPNAILRGTVYSPEEKTTSQKVEETFSTSVSAPLASFADLFGGKICATLDRQHPRDLFDIKLLLENEGLTDKIRRAFVVYLVSHNRPPDELLNPSILDIRQTFETQFRGMTMLDIPFSDLEKARTELIERINSKLTSTEREFIVSLFEGDPKWDHLGIEHIAQLPAIQWKLLNIEKMTKNKRQLALEKIKTVLER